MEKVMASLETNEVWDLVHGTTGESESRWKQVGIPSQDKCGRKC